MPAQNGNAIILPARLENLVRQFEAIRTKVSEKQKEMEFIKIKIARELERNPVYIPGGPKVVRVKATTVSEHERKAFRFVRVGGRV